MTILRKAEHEALSRIMLSGKIADLGGGKRSEYHTFFKGSFSITTANISEKSEPDILCNLEEPLPMEDGAYDGVVLINVLEHIYEYRKLLFECARITKRGGTLVIAVPFMMPFHASPGDFHRYTKETLARALQDSGFTDVRVEALGSGFNAACWLFCQRLLPAFLQPISYVINPLVVLTDKLFAAIAHMMHKKYDPTDYALGFVVEAKKA